MPKRALAALPALVLLLGLAGCGQEPDEDSDARDDTSPSSESSEPTGSGSPTETETVTETGAPGPTCEYPSDGTAADVSPPPSTAAHTGDVQVTISTSVGDLNATLDGARTPCTVNSFVSLAEQQYFDGTSCHRLTTEGIFVLQCGDPTGSGAGGPGYSFADELDGTETYGPGTLAMANAGPNTNGSQFFIVYGDSPLPPSYTVFGQVDDESLAIVEDVAADGSNPPADGAPVTPVDIASVTVG